MSNGNKNNTVWWIIGIVAVIGAVWLMMNANNNANGAPVPEAVPIAENADIQADTAGSTDTADTTADAGA